MKTQLLFLFVLFLLYCLPNATKAEQTQDSLNPCWKMYRHDPKNNYFNPDSVMYDSCLCPGNEDYPPCDYIYAKKWFSITFKNKDPFNFPIGPYDTLYIATWQQLDSTQSELRKIFQNIENIFGTFILKKDFPEVIDSNRPASRIYLIKFDNYVNIWNVSDSFKNSDKLQDVYYLNAVSHYLTDIKENFNFNNVKLKSYELYPNPATDFLELSFAAEQTQSKIEIFSIEGIKMFETESVRRIDVSRLCRGVYFVKYGSRVSKFVKM